MAHTRPADLSRIHDLFYAAAILGRRDDGRDAEYARGLRHDSRVRNGGVRASPDGGDAPSVHRSQPLAGRSRFRRHAARPVALQVVRRYAARPDRSAARHAHPAQGDENAIQPRKRMLSAMTPSIVTDSTGQVQLIVGSPGGPTIITTVAQVILNVLDQHMSLADAVAAPRIHHQALPDQTFYERAGLTDSTVRALEAMGHKMEMRRGHSGVVAAIQKTAGGWVGVSDPRTAGGAIGY